MGNVFGEIERGFHEYGFMANRVSVKDPVWRRGHEEETSVGK
jgi:hypothetical protein